MGLLFKDDLFDEFGSWALSYIPYGGPAFEEIAAVGAATGDGDARAFNKAWIAAGDRRYSQALDAKKSGHLVTARELFLRASVFYNCSYHPLYGAPVDPLLVAAYEKQIDALNAAFALFDPPILPLSIPFEGASMAAYFIPAAGAPRAKRPTIIFTNGFDATITDLYFFSVVAASRRGYHSLDLRRPRPRRHVVQTKCPSPSRLGKTRLRSRRFRAHFARGRPQRIVLNGVSLGGYLAPRAASAEHRLAACIADPGQFAINDSTRAMAIKLGATPDAVTDLGKLDDAIVQKFQHIIDGNAALTWKVVKRGFWAFGVNDLRGFLPKTELFTMAGRAEKIRCPTLLTAAESDPLTSAQKLSSTK